jgi:hypothetical protein
MTPDDGAVDFFDSSLLKEQRGLAVRFRVPGEEHDARRTHIQPVDEPEAGRRFAVDAAGVGEPLDGG